MSVATDRYLAERVLTASPAELTAIVFDTTVGSIGAAMRAQQAGDRATRTAKLLKAQRLVLELRLTLNPAAGELAENLEKLYVYCHERLVAGNQDGNLRAMQEAVDVLVPLRDAWRQSCCRVAA